MNESFNRMVADLGKLEADRAVLGDSLQGKKGTENRPVGQAAEK